jgi:polar amino acid transport system substrate-binding protein
LNRLRELLRDDDSEAVELLEELQDHPVLTAQGALLNHLSVAIDEYDFEVALARLDELEAALHL